MKPTVVLLLSDKRSGSTMVQTELCRHRDIQHVAYSPHRYFETHHWLKAAVMLDRPAEEFSGGKTYPGYGSRSNAAAYLRDCVVGNLPDYELPSDERELVFDSWERLCERFAAPVFFEKSPQYLANWAALSLMLEWMQRTTFSVKIIGLVRNPMSVQHSAQELFHTNPEQRQFGWLEIYQNLEKIESTVPPSNFHLVRYEDLIDENNNGFAEILEFLGLPADPKVGAEVHSRSIDKWRQDPDFALELDETVKAMASKFGYGEEELQSPPRPRASLYRRLYRTLVNTRHKWVARFRYRLLHPLLARLRVNKR